MKTNATYPTKHPHWIDESEYLEAIDKKKRIGISFATAFILVLAVHIAGVGGIFAFSNQKPKAVVPAKPEVVAANPPAPKSDALARNEWPQPEAKPKVVATPPPVKKQVVSATVSPKAEAKPIALGAKKPKSPAPAIAKPTPGIASAVPAAPKSEDSEIKKAFLAARAESKAATQSRQAIPVTPSPQPLVASNAETAAPRTPAPVAVSKQVETAPSTPVATARHVAPRPSEYTLAAGNNLYMVSRKLRVSYNDLMQANGRSDPRQLRVGQKLKVPAEQMASL